MDDQKMNEKEKALVKTGITYGFALSALVRCITDGRFDYEDIACKNLNYWRTIVNKHNKELNKNVLSILSNKKGGF